MTEYELNQYRAIKNEIDDLSFRIKQIENMKVQLTTDRVKGSSKHFPYIEQHFYVTGIDEEEYEHRKMMIRELQRKRNIKLTELIEMESKMHNFIYTIEDSEIRQIFIFRFIDGLSQEEIGQKLHMDRSGVSKRITKYITAVNKG